jgi:endonuclease/exonuclease/phosphatase family metal-dependent hydrolase
MPHGAAVAASPAPSDGRPLAARIARRVVRDGATAALVVVALSLLLRFTVRDTVPGFATVFYATPVVLDAAAAAGASLVSWRCGRPRRAVLGAALALASGALYAGGSFVRNAPREPGAIRGVFWNVQGGDAGWPRIAETLAAFDADVMWLAESGDGSGAADAVFAKTFPGHTILRARGGLTVLVRGRAEQLAWESLPWHGRLAVLRIETKSREFRTVFADVGANGMMRRLPLSRVRAIAGAHLGGPLLVLGDFNTPRDAAEFDGWRGPLAHAFETTGRGLDATWPVPAPVLSLDHVWAGGGIRVRTCELPWTWRSDHLPVVFTFDAP